MGTKLTDEVIEKSLKKNEPEAEELIKDSDKLEDFLVKLEKKLVDIPVAGKAFSNVPVLISLVRAYAKKEYTEVPVGTIVAIIAALLYVFSPIDLIPDTIPVIGFADDAAVVMFCMEKVKEDLDDYKLWRDNNIEA
mgnify:CR=1 FL=1